MWCPGLALVLRVWSPSVAAEVAWVLNLPEKGATHGAGTASVTTISQQGRTSSGRKGSLFSCAHSTMGMLVSRCCPGHVCLNHLSVEAPPGVTGFLWGQGSDRAEVEQGERGQVLRQESCRARAGKEVRLRWGHREESGGAPRRER